MRDASTTAERMLVDLVNNEGVLGVKERVKG
jgi:hypothetical protein